MTVHIFSQAIPQAVLAAVRQDALALAECSNFWVPKERICQAPFRCSSPAELAACLLYQHVAHLLPDNWQGAEYWVQVYKPGVGLGFHFDKDEHLLKLTGEMVHPAWSSVLYLTGSLDDSSSSTNTAGSIHMTGRASHGSTDACPAAQQQQRQPADRQPVQLTSTAEFPKSAEVTAAANFKTARELETTGHLEAYGANDDWDGCRQAPTVILEQRFNQELNSPVPLNPNRTTLVWPLKGNYCVFDGQLGHGVLDSCSSSVRATLLVNWWTSCPKGVHELEDVSIKQYCLTHLDSQHIDQMLQQQHCSCGSLPDTLEPDVDAAAAASGCSVACCHSSLGTGNAQNDIIVQSTCRVSSTAGRATCKSAASGQCNEQQQQQQQQQPQHVQQVDVPEVLISLEESAGDMVLVDDVLLNRRLPLVGASAISAVHFVHPGYTLCPIEAPHAQQQLELHSQQQDVQVEYLSQQGLQPSMSQVATSCREAGQAHPNECLQGGGTGSGAASSSGDGCEGRLQTLGAFVPTDCLDSEGSDSSAGEADSS